MTAEMKLTEPINKYAIQKYLVDFADDGHSILPTEMLIEYGFPESLVDGLEQTHPSGAGKWQITVDRTPVSEFRGVWTLELLEAIATALDVKPERYVIGRGTQAQLYTKAIREALEDPKTVKN